MAVPKPKEAGEGFTFKNCKTRTLLRIVKNTGCEFTQREIDRRRASGKDRHLPRPRVPSDEERAEMKKRAMDNPRPSQWNTSGDARPYDIRREEYLRQSVVDAGSMDIARAYYYFEKMDENGNEVYSAEEIQGTRMMSTKAKKEEEERKSGKSKKRSKKKKSAKSKSSTTESA